MTKTKGEIRIPVDTNVWKHELHTANALAKAGYVVEFLPSRNMKNIKSPDILMGGEKWELKSPRTDKLSAWSATLSALLSSQAMSSSTHAGFAKYMTRLSSNFL